MTTGRLPSIEGGIQPTIVDAKGDLIVATAADTVSRIAVGSNDQVLTADSSTATGLKWAAAASGLTQASSGVATEQTTTSTSYTDLATTQSVTLTTGTKALVMLSAGAYNNSSTAYSLMSVAVSGASSVSAADAYALRLGYQGTVGVSLKAASFAVLTGLTAGSNTFTVKHRVTGSTGGWNDRYLFVMDLGS